MMIQLQELPKVNQDQIVLFRSQFSLKERLKQMFSTQPELPTVFRGRRMYDDVVVADPDNTLTVEKRYDLLQAVYSAKEPDYHKMIDHTVYNIYGLTAYGILGDNKICTVDKFEILLDKCWKTPY